MTDPQITLPRSIVEGIHAYLVTRPYAEVDQGVQALESYLRPQPSKVPVVADDAEMEKAIDARHK